MCLKASVALIQAGALFLLALPLAGQGIVFGDDFEWGDTGEWSWVEPPRCDRIDTFDRGLEPFAELHVATWGDDNSGNGTEGNPYATIDRAVDEAVPGTAVRVHSGT